MTLTVSDATTHKPEDKNENQSEEKPFEASTNACPLDSQAVEDLCMQVSHVTQKRVFRDL